MNIAMTILKIRKDKIALMSKKSFELYEEIYGQYE